LVTCKYQILCKFFGSRWLKQKPVHQSINQSINQSIKINKLSLVLERWCKGIASRAGRPLRMHYPHQRGGAVLQHCRRPNKGMHAMRNHHSHLKKRNHHSHLKKSFKKIPYGGVPVSPLLAARRGAMTGSRTRAAASTSSRGVWKLCVSSCCTACSIGFYSRPSCAKVQRLVRTSLGFRV
jgi:hypothetical protein